MENRTKSKKKKKGDPFFRCFKYLHGHGNIKSILILYCLIFFEVNYHVQCGYIHERNRIVT